MTPLHYASQNPEHNNISVELHLIEKGANVNAKEMYTIIFIL